VCACVTAGVFESRRALRERHQLPCLRSLSSHLYERGLARAVGADEGDARVEVEAEVHVLVQRGLPVVAKGQAVHLFCEKQQQQQSSKPTYSET